MKIPEKEGTRVHVGGLRPEVTRKDLQNIFGIFGPIIDVWIAHNPPGFGFIRFEKVADAEKACTHLDGKVLDGKPIGVSLACTKFYEERENLYKYLLEKRKAEEAARKAKKPAGEKAKEEPESTTAEVKEAKSSGSSEKASAEAALPRNEKTHSETALQLYKKEPAEIYWPFNNEGNSAFRDQAEQHCTCHGYGPGGKMSRQRYDNQNEFRDSYQGGSTRQAARPYPATPWRQSPRGQWEGQFTAADTPWAFQAPYPQPHFGAEMGMTSFHQAFSGGGSGALPPVHTMQQFTAAATVPHYTPQVAPPHYLTQAPFPETSPIDYATTLAAYAHFGSPHYAG